jgi:hypothetical protein
MKKSIWHLVLIAAFVAAFLWILTQKPGNEIENTRPEFEVSAEQLSLEFYSDESLANANYLSKYVAVSGEVLKDSSEDGQKFVWLKGTPNGPNLRCRLGNTVGPRTAFQNNESIRLKCVCTGLTDNVELMQCEEW